MLGWGYTTPAPIAMLVTWWESGDTYVIDGTSVQAQQKYNDVMVTFETNTTDEQRDVVSEIIKPLAHRYRLSVKFQ